MNSLIIWSFSSIMFHFDMILCSNVMYIVYSKTLIVKNRFCHNEEIRFSFNFTPISKIFPGAFLNLNIPSQGCQRPRQISVNVLFDYWTKRWLFFIFWNTLNFLLGNLVENISLINFDIMIRSLIYFKGLLERCTRLGRTRKS